MKQFFLILSSLALLAGCSRKNDSTEWPVYAQVRIAPTITRVTGLNFDTGDRIGLTITKSGSGYCENAPLRYDGTVFVSDDLFWYDNTSEKSNLTAYYPYLAEGAPARFSIRSDQRLEADHTASDLLAATATDVTPSESAVNMLFVHLLTKVVIDITNNTGKTISQVTLKGTYGTANIDLSAQSAQVDASSAKADIYPFPTTDGSRYTAVLIPQQAELVLEIQTSDGKLHTKTFQATDLKSGAEYAIEAVISNTDKILASISGAIKDWADGGVIDPAEDVLPDDSDLLEYEGVKYRIRQFSNGTTWMAENLRYIPQGKTVSSSPADENGIWYPCTPSFTASSDAAYIEQQGLLYDLATAVGEPVTENNFRKIEGVQGICPDGWHLPTQADLEALIALSSEIGNSFFTYAGTRDTSGKYLGSLMSGDFSKGYLLCTSTESAVYSPQDLNYQYLLFSKSSQVSIIGIDCRSGMPVRCVKNTVSGK
ncbi:fimbrillin family protein [Alistipes putredinis]|uniref:fimbrillin family protein n=1 Tax=Alistipes putredinis TaxID=28117 RepID=UPI003AB72ADE